MDDYDRGKRDAELFSEVRLNGIECIGVLESTGIEALILEPVNDRYIAGLIAGRCVVLVPLEVRSGAVRRNQAVLSSNCPAA